MAKHTYTKCLIHMVWGTKNRQPVLTREVRRQLSNFLYNYTDDKEIYMYINYVNADHVHALIDLPPTFALQKIFKLFKGASSHWINKNRLTSQKFSWARGYGGFSVSASAIDKVITYIRNQEEHHRTKTFTEEYNEFIEACGLEV